MLSNELYTSNYFKTGRYAPDYDKYVIKAFSDGSLVVQAQQFVPNGDKLGGGKLGRVYNIVTDVGGISPGREYMGGVDSLVVDTVPKTVFMGINSEKVIYDVGQVDDMGYSEHDLQLQMAIARLQRTFVFKLFNSKVGETYSDGSGKEVVFEFDGYVKYFEDNTGQVDNDVLVVGDLANSPNLRYFANDKLNSVNALVDVRGNKGEVIYTTARGATILAALESDKRNYNGKYKFTGNVQSYDGLPVITIPDFAVPIEWRNNGEFVMFVNQDEIDGCHIMVNRKASLIKTYEEANLGFQKYIPMDMTFGLVAVNPKAASLCFLKRGNPNKPGGGDENGGGD